MKSRLQTILLALAVPVAASAAPVTYDIDPLHSFPYFSVNHMGMSNIHGRFERMTGKVVYDSAAKTGSMEVKVPTATVSTGDARRENGARSRDEHLRSADFFNSAEFPDMAFKSTKFNFAGDKLDSIEGNLTMVGVTRPVKLQVTHFVCGPNPYSKKPMCGAGAEGTIKRTDFGIKYGVPGISDEVKLEIGVEAYAE
ncbi:MAG TPA: YceI family protein [Ramlibacter sp.]